jgi:adenylate kinase
MRSLRIVLLGPPGSGKGTQAKLIASKEGLSHLSTGDILRDEVKKRSKLGREAEGYMNQGALVPDELIIEMIRGRIVGLDGFILDGFPRTVAQAEALADIIQLQLVINIVLPRAEVIKRLTARRVCRDCGRIYNIFFDPPEDPTRCPACGGELFQRDDDRAEVIENRYDVYMKETALLIDFYRDRGLLQQVDGRQSVSDVNAEITALIER